jgi:hypothetical protein
MATERASGTHGGDGGAADPEAPTGPLLPVVLGTAVAVRAGAAGGRAAGVDVRRLDATGRPAGRESTTADLHVGGQPGLPSPGRARRRRPHATTGGLPIRTCSSTPRSRRSRPADAWSTRRCDRRMPSTSLGGARSFRSTSASRDQGVLNELPARPRRAWPGLRPAREDASATRATILVGLASDGNWPPLVVRAVQLGP